MSRLEDLRKPLLHLHQSFVDAERIDYERLHGRMPAGQMLEVLIREPAFAWLKPLTATIVQLDEWIDDEAARDPAAEAQRVTSLAEMIRPDAAGDQFQQRYAALLQQSPEVVVAHAAVTRALR